MDRTKVRDILLTDGCDLFDIKFDVPYTSHVRGVWKRPIRTVWNILTSMIDNLGIQLEDEDLETFMIEAVAIVNSRTLTNNTLYYSS